MGAWRLYFFGNKIRGVPNRHLPDFKNCLVTVKVSEHILSKVEPIIKDICKRLIENN